MIRTVIVDDSPSFRAMLSHLLQQGTQFEVVGCAPNGAEGVSLVQAHRPDLVLMDVVMPSMDGLAATLEIMRAAPCPVVVLSALVNSSDQRVVFDAMRAGAVEVLPKPHARASSEERARWLAHLAAMAEVRVVRRRSSPATRPQPTPPIELLAIGASTGGPPALREVLGALPAGFGAPVLVAQHLAEGFARGFGEWLRDAVQLRVEIVTAEQPLEAGCVYLPVDRHHLEAVGSGRVRARLDESAVTVPSVNRLFHSLSGFDGRGAAVVLTGMGRDGAEGLAALRSRGFHTIVQDEATSVVYGMPRVARELGAAVEELPLDQIGPRLATLARGQP